MSKYEMYVEIPAKPHVKLYLEKHIFFRSFDDKPLVITTSSTVGSYLLKLLRSKAKKNFPLRYNQSRTVRVHLNDNYNVIVKPYLSPAAAKQFNLFIERKIKEECYVFLDAIQLCGKDINEGIKMFQEKYNIKDEEFSFDRLKQAYFRYRNASKARANKAA